MIYLLIGYMWLFIHRPFEVWPWLAPYRIEFVWGGFTLAYWALFHDKRWTNNRLVIASSVLVAVIVASTLFNGDPVFGTKILWEWYKVVLFAVVMVTSVRDERDLRILVTGFLLCFGLYMLHSYREFLCGRHVTRQGVQRLTSIDATYSPNGFAGLIVSALPMVLPVWKLSRKSWQRLALAGYVVLSVTCVVLTGSRTGFVALLSLCLIVTVLSRFRLRILAALLVAATLLWTWMGAALQNRFLTLIDPSYGPAIAQRSAEARWKFFKLSVEIWRENPIFGVGPRGFDRIAGSTFGSEVAVHSLYGQLVGELGTVGVVTFLAVLACYFLNDLEARRLCASMPGESAVFLRALSKSVLVSVVLLMVVGLGGHNLYWYPWLWFGALQVLAVSILRRQSAHAADAAWSAAEAQACPAVAGRSVPSEDICPYPGFQ